MFLDKSIRNSEFLYNKFSADYNVTIHDNNSR